MAMRIRFQYPTGSQLGYSIERLADGKYYDFTNGTFTATPANPVAVLPEDTGNFTGRYIVTMASTPVALFPNGDYIVTIHDRSALNVVVAELATTMNGGDDATVFPGGVVAGVISPVTVGTVNDKSGYTLASNALDAIQVEAGVNARQALSPILAASAGTVAGAGTGVIVIKGGNTSITRITASTDNAGNRSSVTLTLPT